MRQNFCLLEGLQNMSVCVSRSVFASACVCVMCLCMCVFVCVSACVSAHKCKCNTLIHLSGSKKNNNEKHGCEDGKIVQFFNENSALVLITF